MKRNRPLNAAGDEFQKVVRTWVALSCDTLPMHAQLYRLVSEKGGPWVIQRLHEAQAARWIGTLEARPEFELKAAVAEQFVWA